MFSNQRLGSRDAVGAHVWAQHVWDDDRAIGLLIIFYDGDPSAPYGQAGTIQCVHEFTLPASLGLETNSRPPCLKGLAIGARGNLAKFIAGGQPDLEVIGFRRCKAHVAGAEQHGSVMQAQFLQHCFGVSSQGFVLFVTFLGMRELEKFNLLELVLPQDAARVLASRSRFGTEAGGPSGHLEWQFVFWNGLVAIEVVKLHFAGGREPEVGALNLEEISSKFWQLAGSEQRRAVDEERRKNFRVTVLASVHIEKEICQRTFQSRSPAFVHCKACPGDFRGRSEIEDPRALANFPVRLCG